MRTYLGLGFLAALFLLSGCTDVRTCQPCQVYEWDGKPQAGYKWDTPTWSMNHGTSGPGCIPCERAQSPEALAICKERKTYGQP